MIGLTKLLLLPIIFFSSVSYASNLGIIGQVYAIKEEDFLQFIMKRLHHMQENGQLEQFQNQLRNNVEKHAIRPVPVESVSRTRKDKSWNFDPSIIVPHDLTDHEGRLIARKDMVVNPLKMLTIHHDLVFFDGDDKEQVAWVLHLQTTRQNKAKLVLVNGSVQSQEKIFHCPIYFDQAGRLTSRFHIEHVPAIVSQEGFHLLIREVLI